MPSEKTAYLYSTHRYTIPSLQRYVEDFIASPQEYRGDYAKKISPLQGRVLEELLVTMKFDEGMLLLDIGAGTSKVSHCIREMELPIQRDFGRVVPLEVSPVALGRAADTYGLEGVCADARSLPFRSGSFTGALLLQLLEFVPSADRRRVLTEAIRTLRPGTGRIYVISAQYRQQEQDVVDLERQHETGMMFEPVKQGEVIQLLSLGGCVMESVKGMSVYRPNDFFMLVARRRHDEQEADKGAGAEETAKGRSSIWD